MAPSPVPFHSSRHLHPHHCIHRRLRPLAPALQRWLGGVRCWQGALLQVLDCCRLLILNHPHAHAHAHARCRDHHCPGCSWQRQAGGGNWLRKDGDHGWKQDVHQTLMEGCFCPWTPPHLQVNVAGTVQGNACYIPNSFKESQLHTYVGLERTTYIRCIYVIFGRQITKYTVIYGVFIRFWPTLHIWHQGTVKSGLSLQSPTFEHHLTCTRSRVSCLLI